MNKVKTIFLDMDGVIADFRKGCEKYDAIQGTKVNWEIIHKMGEDFWANLEWCEGGEIFYKWLVKYCKETRIDLCILSAINYESGITGKQIWLDNNCKEIPKQNRYFVARGNMKAKWASKDSLLIDDFGKNIEHFVMAGGHGVKYKNGNQAKEELLGI